MNHSERRKATNLTRLKENTKRLVKEFYDKKKEDK
jgi:hypothetical protein